MTSAAVIEGYPEYNPLARNCDDQLCEAREFVSQLVREGVHRTGSSFGPFFMAFPSLKRLAGLVVRFRHKDIQDRLPDSLYEWVKNLKDY